MRVRCFRTGDVREKRRERGIRRYLADDWRDEAIPVNTFLVEHPAGLLLFDTGQTARAARPGYFPWWQPFFRLARFELEAEDEASAQLAAAGIAPQNVRWVVLSHLHTDHVAGLAPFAAAEVLVARREWEIAQGLRGRIRGYVPHEWPDGLVPRVVDFDGPSVGPFAASYDIAGDGSLLLVPTPGHTAGHTALLVLGESQRWLIGGDMAHDGEELAAKAPAVAEFCAREGVVFLATHDRRAEELLR